jgi:penicillin-binding protein 2
MERRISIALYIILFIFGTLVFRLWYLQIIKSGEYRVIDERNRLRVIDIPAPRGIIYDRNGNALVKNVPSFDITVVKEDLPKDPETLAKLAKLIGLKQDKLVESLKSVSKRPFKPVTLKQNVSFEEVARVEARKIDFPGLQVNVVGGREYIYGHSASHVIGYLGHLRLEQLRSPEYSNLPRETFVGQFGVEKVFDDTLRGIAGKKVIEVDAFGRIIKVVRINRPVKGKDITLTIDINLQVEAEKSLEGKAGAVVALNPDTGEVLALASAPSFDPNLFVRGINYDDWKKLVNDPRKPLLNRAIQSQYPPGSTFKIITAIAALEEGIVTKDTSFYCGGYTYFGRIFRCWKEGGHGKVRLHRAIVESCDVYFYEIAKRLDIDVLAQYALGYGLGRPTGIELENEAPGIVPSTGWKLETKKEVWYKGETLNTVIGQGYLSATPIQMARLMAAVVNGGKLYEPYLLFGSETKAKGIININPEYINLVKKALIGVVEDKDGTGKMAKSDKVRIGGKTGTTQVIGGVIKEEELPDRYKDHAWFVAFAPEDNPEIVVTVFVEHGGHGSTSAAPIAKRIIEAYYIEEQKHKGQNDS